MADDDFLYAETRLACASVLPITSEAVGLSTRAQRRLRRFFGSDAGTVPVRWGRLPDQIRAAALCTPSAIFLDPALADRSEEQLLGTVAHEMAHAVQQRFCRAEGATRAVLVEDRALEAEAVEAASRFLAGAPASNLTPINRTSLEGHVIVQCQPYGAVGAQTLQLGHGWVGPAALGGGLNVTYSAVNSRNEVYNGRAAAHTRAKQLAGVGRAARRTYHFVGVVANNEGSQINAPVPAGMMGPARVGRYYDFGKGPAGRLLIVEHTSDQNALVTVGAVAHAVTAHFHICTYGQHADPYVSWRRPADGRNWQQFEYDTIYLPFYSAPGVPGFRTPYEPRAYELDGRFGEHGANTHHIYYV